MTSHELAKELLQLPNYQIIMSEDGEGNSFSTLEREYSIQVYDEEEEDVNQPLIILYPYQNRLDLDEIPV